MSDQEFQQHDGLRIRKGDFGELDQLIRPEGEVKLTFAKLSELDVTGKINWPEDVIYS